MKTFIKENWFKLAIVLFLVFISVFIIFNYKQYSYNEDTSSKLNSVITPLIATTTEDLKKTADIKGDDYIFTYDKDGNPITWAIATRASVILNDTLTTYKTSLPEIQKPQDSEQKNIGSAYAVLSRITDPNQKLQMQTLIKYEEDYLSSGDKLIGLLKGLITNYEGLIKATGLRDAILYNYYSDQLAPLESQKSSILSDYSTKQKVKQDYAKSMSSQ